MPYLLLTKEELLDIYRDQIASFGGKEGLTDEGGLEAALARPGLILDYNPDASIFDIAAALFFSITINRHPFVDGNKRAGFAACDVTLMLNGYQLDATQSDILDKIEQAIKRSFSEQEFSDWLKENSYRNKSLEEL